MTLRTDPNRPGGWGLPHAPIPGDLVGHWGPMHADMGLEGLLHESSGCYGCGAPNCESGANTVPGCPLKRNIRDTHGAVESARMRLAFSTWHKASPFSGLYGGVCEGPCQAACNAAAAVAAPVRMPLTESAMFQHGKEKALFKPLKPAENGLRVAVIGAGIAGLEAAWKLRSKGFEVHIFESRRQIGGLLHDGIPVPHFPRDPLGFYRDLLAESGIQMHFGQCVGRDLQVTSHDRGRFKVQGQGVFDGIVYAVGARRPRELSEDMSTTKRHDFINPLAFLWSGVQAAAGEEHGSSWENGDTAIVVGAGYTARDCIMTAHRLGLNVHVLVRKPTIGDETLHRWGLAPDSREEIARVCGAEGATVHFESTLSSFTDGKASVQTADGSIELDADWIIPALGLQGPGVPHGLDALGLVANSSGFLNSGHPMVHVAGDARATGDTGWTQTLAHAGGSGKMAADDLAQALLGQTEAMAV